MSVTSPAFSPATISNPSARYVYGVMANGVFPVGSNRFGLDRQPVRLVRHGGLAAVVSPCSATIRATRANVAAHERVVETIRQHGTVLPVAFGRVVPLGDVAVAELLDGHAEYLAALLSQMDGQVEFRVRASYLPDVVWHEAVHVDATVRRFREHREELSEAERVDLGQLVADAVGRIRGRDASSLMACLGVCATRCLALPNPNEQVAMDAAFLVSGHQVPRFENMLRSLGDDEAHRLRFRTEGPLAPWDFVSLTLASAGRLGQGGTFG